MSEIDEMITEMKAINKAIIILKKENKLLNGENILLKKEVVRLKWILEHQD